MTKNMAERLLDEFIIAMETETQNSNLPVDIEEAILDKCIAITVDECDEKSIMVLDEKPKSIKLANISIDLKQAIEIVFEIALTSAIPTDKLSAVKMVLLVVLKAWQLSRKSISKQMADIVLILNNLNAYHREIPIEYLKDYVNQHSLLPESERSDTVDAILNELHAYKIIDINEGRVRLKEKIVYSK